MSDDTKAAFQEVPDGEEPPASSLFDRRDFLKTAGATAGLLAVGGQTLGAEPPPPPVAKATYGGMAPKVNGKSYDVAVVGAGAWGGWTAYWLRRMGASVLLIDAYGPGNGRSTSGDETRGVRTSYGDRPHGEQWMRWASRAITRWRSWDDEWGKDLKMRLFYTTGDFIFRNDWESFSKTTRDLYVKVGIRHEVVPVDDVRKQYPVIDLNGITVCLYEPDAGVVRARRATQCVAEVFMKLGGDLMTIRAYPSLARNGKMDDLILSNRETVKAGQYVFALGPWMPKAFPGVMGPRMRTPLGQVVYFATPIADERFTFPNLPSYNFPGVTGWPTLPYDSRGFRVRGGANPGGGGGGGGRGGAGAGDQAAGGGGGGGRGGGRGGGGGAPVDPFNPQQDPDLSSRFVDLDAQQRSRNFVAERFPLLKDSPINETRSCHYEQSITRNFIIDNHPDMANVWLAGGGSAEGFKFGPVVGEYVARRVLNKDLEPELAAGFKLPKETYDDPVVAGGGGGRGSGGD